MKNRIAVLVLCLVMYSISAFAQAPSVQIKVKEKSGFLGMGGPRIINIELSNQARQPVSSENVSSGLYYYFLVSPAGDWKLDADFVKDDLPRLTVYQNEQKFPIAWKGEIVADPKTTILLGFPKLVRLHQLFLFQAQVGDATSQVEFKVPQELWPGYSVLNDLTKQADSELSARKYRSAISFYEKIVDSPALQIFPQYAEAKEKRTKAFDSYLNETSAGFQAASASQLDLKEKIAELEKFRPTFQFFVDSLPRAAWGIGSLDATIAPIIDRARTGLNQANSMVDSLSRALEERNTKWIIEGSASGREGYKYQYIVQALAYAFSTANFADTAATTLTLTLPENLQALLAKYNITESYETFLRICNDRFMNRLPVFPVDFLPNLRKDTSYFDLPFYSMLKAVNDYFYGSFAVAKDEIFKVFRTCYDPDLNARFDQMRIMIAIREQRVPLDVMKMIQEAEQLEGKKDTQGAQDKYQQVRVIAPNFAYGYYALGKFYARSGDEIRANNSFSKAYQLDTLYLSAYRDSYNLFFKKGNYAPMIDVLTLAFEHGNDYWEVNTNLGNAYMGASDPARAIQSFERALALNPKSYKTNISLGQAHMTVKNFQKAREYFNKAIELDPNRSEAVDLMSKLMELQRNAH
ncbi:MAG: tetratricopeptide repeat protein [Bacteroidota bacterium]